MMKGLYQFRSIRSKMLFGFALILGLVVALSVFTYISTTKTSDDTKYLTDEQVPLLVANHKLAFNAAQLMAATRGFILFDDTEFLTLFDDFTRDSEQFQEQILALTDSDDARELVAKSIEWRDYVTENVIAVYQNGDAELAASNLQTSNHLIRDVMNGFNELAVERENIFNSTAGDILQSNDSAILVDLVITVIVILLGVATAFLTANSVTRPIRMVMDKMNVIASGDLTHEPLTTNSKDETAQLFAATNEMNDNMKTVLEEIQNVSSLVGNQSAELTHASNEVTFGTEQIAATMEELAAGAETEAGHATQLAENMELFTTRSSETSEGGMAIQTASNNVLNMTIEGQQLMVQSTEQMNVIYSIIRESVEKVHALNTESEKISELVEVIQGIAEQTNLLALNAAIEAARAGEQGQGFAVVADEVRKLAEGVSVSVTDITGIVSSIQNQSNDVTASLENGYEEVSQGTNRVVETGETFGEITVAVKEVVQHIGEMANHLNDMSTETARMSQSVQEIAAISEESAAGIEETSASSIQMSSSMNDITTSSNDLAQLAEQMNDLVKRFKI